jgi:hypothetical protein
MTPLLFGCDSVVESQKYAAVALPLFSSRPIKIQKIVHWNR